MDQSHHHAATNKAVLNKYLALDQGTRWNQRWLCLLDFLILQIKLFYDPKKCIVCKMQ